MDKKFFEDIPQWIKIWLYIFMTIIVIVLVTALISPYIYKKHHIYDVRIMPSNNQRIIIEDSVVEKQREELIEYYDYQIDSLSSVINKQRTQINMLEQSQKSSNKKSLKPSLKKKIGYLPIDTMECSDTKVIIVKQVNIN